MQQILLFIIKWALCLAILYVPFILLMRKETFHTFKRTLLLLIIVISSLLPIANVTIPIEIEQSVAKSSEIFSVQDTVSAYIQKSSETRKNQLWKIIFAIYATGVTLSLSAIIVNIIRIKKAIRNGTLWIEEKECYTLFCHANNTPPFSWFNNIVISESDYKECANEIIAHEEGHIKFKHSWDILATNIIKAIQWFNPFIYMLINDLKDIHEYQADRHVLEKNSDPRAYQLLILKKATAESAYTIANNFGKKSVRKRIEMMIRKKSSNSKMYKASYMLPVAATTIILFAKPVYIYSNKEQPIELQTYAIEEEKRAVIDLDSSSRKAVSLTQATPAKKRTEKKSNINTIINKDTIAVIPTTNSETECLQVQHIIKEKEIAAEFALDKKHLGSRANSLSDIKCSTVIEFDTDNKGKVSHIVARVCNISMNNESNIASEEILPHLRRGAIEAATAYICSKKWTDEPTHYIAKLTMHSEDRASSTTAQNNSDTFWIGTTPIK